MNLKQMVIDSLRRGTPIPKILEHHSINEHDVLQIAADELNPRLPAHITEYLRLQEMESLWAEASCHNGLLSTEAFRMLSIQRDHFHLAMEREIRRVTGIVTTPEIRPVVEAFQKALAPRKIKRGKR